MNGGSLIPTKRPLPKISQPFAKHLMTSPLAIAASIGETSIANFVNDTVYELSHELSCPLTQTRGCRR